MASSAGWITSALPATARLAPARSGSGVPPRTVPAALASSGMTAPGITPRTRHGTASSAVPASIAGPASAAAAASGVRGWPRNPMPNAFTNAAAVRPPVSASAATPASSMAAVAAPCAEKPRSRPCSSSHSLAKPLNGGSAQIDSAPIPNSAAVTGRRRASPPRLSRSRVPAARWTDPAARNRHPLNAEWFDQLEQRRDQGKRGQRVIAPGRRGRPRRRRRSGRAPCCRPWSRRAAA